MMVFCQLTVTTQTSGLSVLFFFWYVKQCGGFYRSFGRDNGGQVQKQYVLYISYCVAAPLIYM